VQVTNNTNLRVQIQTSTNQRWCANVTGLSVSIPWTSFNTACWNNSGTYYTVGTPIVDLAFQIPGDTGGVRNFNYCVTNISFY
jgi:hypothetical protein